MLLTRRALATYAVAGLAASPARADDLIELQWRRRIVLVFAPTPEDTRLIDQRAIFRNALAGFEERDAVGFELSDGVVRSMPDRSPSGFAPAGVRRVARARARGFEVVLVGKDGGVKRRWDAPVPAAAVFAAIDAMPMRQREIAEERR
ncbi:MAG: DUF4174 domain-containing protein [Parvularculaceae bacterium]